MKPTYNIQHRAGDDATASAPSQLADPAARCYDDPFLSIETEELLHHAVARRVALKHIARTSNGGPRRSCSSFSLASAA